LYRRGGQGLAAGDASENESRGRAGTPGHDHVRLQAVADDQALRRRQATHAGQAGLDDKGRGFAGDPLDALARAALNSADDRRCVGDLAALDGAGAVGVGGYETRSPAQCLEGDV